MNQRGEVVHEGEHRLMVETRKAGQVGLRGVTGRSPCSKARGHPVQGRHAEAAARAVRDGATVGVEGAGRLLLSEAVSSAIERRFLATGRPRGITLLQPCGFGDDGDAGASHFAHEGLVRRVISPGWGDSPRMAALALANRIEAYCFPQGVVCQMVWAGAQPEAAGPSRTSASTPSWIRGRAGDG